MKRKPRALVDLDDVRPWSVPNFVTFDSSGRSIDIADLHDHDLMMLALRWQKALEANARKRRKSHKATP